MTSFKDYLDKNSWVLNSHSDTKVISTETLGEWAMAEIKKIICYAPIYPVTLDFYKEIASACLGRDEVMRRLKELNK